MKGRRLLLLAALLAGAAGAHARVLCETPHHTIAVRAQCRPREHSVDLTEFGPVGPPGPPGPPGTPGAPTVRDATGAFVGYVTSKGALRIVNGVPAYLQVTTAGVFETFIAEIEYALPDCAGTPYFSFPGDFASLPQLAIVVGHQAFVATGPQTTTTEVRSVRLGPLPPGETESGTCGTVCPPDGTCCNVPAGCELGLLTPATAIDLDTLGLTPPFRIDAPTP
jgi:hypothetical protein